MAGVRTPRQTADVRTAVADKDDSHPVKVVLRCRPALVSELQYGANAVAAMTDYPNAVRVQVRLKLIETLVLFPSPFFPAFPFPFPFPFRSPFRFPFDMVSGSSEIPKAITRSYSTWWQLQDYQSETIRSLHSIHRYGVPSTSLFCRAQISYEHSPYIYLECLVRRFSCFQGNAGEIH